MAKTKKRPTISIIIPVYNEGGYINDLISAIKDTPNVCEILLVDDCSESKYAQMYDKIEGVRVIHKPVNEGKDKAIKTGYLESKGDYIMILDGDLQGLTQEHLEKIQINIPEYEVINMIRGADYPLAKMTGNTYITVGEHLISREVVEKYKEKLFKDEEWSFDNELNKIFIENPELKVLFCELDGVKHILKGKKYGLLKGVMLDVKMMSNLFFVKYKGIEYLTTYIALSKYIKNRQKISG